jgi:hypothetical protein
VEAVRLDFGEVAANLFRPALEAFPVCTRCGQFRALSTNDSLCYGCRKYGGMRVCTTCRLYWAADSVCCQKCGGTLGDAVHAARVEPEEDDFAKLMADAELLESRCERPYSSDAARRRQYREMRRRDPELARQSPNDIDSYPEPDRTLNSDLDRFYNAICLIYLSSLHRGAEIRALLGANKRLLQELYSYAFRRASEFVNTGNKDTLLCGIAAASIDNGRGTRNFDDPLGKLYRAAEERGLDPSFFFFLAACCSENDTRYKLENFEQSEYFVRFVKPHMRKCEP